jgi:hypothetical protein
MSPDGFDGGVAVLAQAADDDPAKNINNPTIMPRVSPLLPCKYAIATSSIQI